MIGKVSAEEFVLFSFATASWWFPRVAAKLGLKYVARLEKVSITARPSMTLAP